MRLRQFNASGIDRFRLVLQTCRENPLAAIDLQLLEDKELTEEVQGDVEVTAQAFTTKGDAGHYLHSLLDPILAHDDIMANIGLWSWLSLYFFDSVCPPDSQGKRRVNNDCHYIYEPVSRYYCRHLLFISWRILDITKTHHRLFSTTKISILDRVTLEVFGKLYLVRIPCIFEVLDRIYWKEQSERVRKNVAGSEIMKGDLTHRFPMMIQQLEKTYDLQSLSADQLIGLLGSEFDFAA
jgi:hypothetical protein